MKKILTIGLSMVIVAAIAITGTLAYLSAETTAIVNTFSFGNINMTLTETYEQDSKIYPGAVIDKTPVVTIKANSEDAYAYVMVDNGFGTHATLDINTGWTAIGTSGTKTLYRYNTVVAAATTDTALPAIFTKVTISGANVNETNIATVAASDIVIDAFAYQANGGVTVAQANAAAASHFTVTLLP